MSANDFSEQRIRDCVTRALRLTGPASASLQMGSTPGWDSMGHMVVVMALEKDFGVRFPAHRLPELTNIESIAAAIRAQVPQK
jgi:acyl carrier protein